MYKGIGNDFRCLSQYTIMRRWEKKYKIRSALEAPYDHATNGIDGKVFSCPHTASRLLDGYQPKSFDFVWNFGFVQREPQLIHRMREVSCRLVAAFVPNIYNVGISLFHPIYHWLYKIPCTHPERGNPSLMNLRGLSWLFKREGLVILEEGYLDCPPWPDTIITLSELFTGSTERRYIKIPFPVEKIFAFEQIAFPRRFFAHHVYVLGKNR